MTRLSQVAPELEASGLRSLGRHRPLELHRPQHATLRREGFIIGIWETLVAAEPPRVFALVERIGGTNGWYFADDLWVARGWLDCLLGGVGMRRRDGARAALRAGDALDFWRIESLRPGAFLRLRAEMKMPGEAWLQFACLPRQAGHTLLRMTVFFRPRGFAGQLYWAALYPFHVFLFDGMHQAIARKACSLR